MNLFRRRKYTALVTFFTERVGLDELVAYAFPRPAISPFGVWTSVVFFVAFALEPFVLLAVPAMCKLGASRIRAWSLRFLWHGFTSFSQNRKAFTGITPHEGLSYFFYLNNTTGGY